MSQVQLGERGLPVDSRLAFWLNQSASNTSLPGQDDPPGRFFIWAGARYIRPHRPFHPAHMAKRDNRRGAESQAPHRRTSSLIGPCISSFPALFRLQRWTEFLPFVRLGATRLGGSCHASDDARPCANPNVLSCLLRLARGGVPAGDDQRRAVRNFPGFLDDYRGYLYPSSTTDGWA